MKKYSRVKRDIMAVQLPRRGSALPYSQEITDFLNHYGLKYKIHSTDGKFTGLSVSKDGNKFTRLGPTRWLYVEYEEGLDGGIGDMLNSYFREQYEEVNDE